MSSAPRIVSDPIVRSIARMLCPTRTMQGWSPPDPRQYVELVQACVRNKVPLLSVDTDALPSLAPFFAGEAFQGACRAEQERWLGLRHEYLTMHEAFVAAGIVAVMIKAAGIAPALTYKSDNLDILVPLDEGACARDILHELGYIELKNVEEPHKFLFRKFHGGTTVSAIHLHEFVGWGTGFMADDLVLSRSRISADDSAVLIPCPEHSLLITMAHAFYEDKEVKLGDLWKVMHVLQSSVLDWDAIYYQTMLRGWREGLDTCILLWAELEKALYATYSFPLDVVERAERHLPTYCREYLHERLGQPVRFPFGISFKFSKRHYYGKVLRDQTIGVRQKAADVVLHSWAGVARRLPFKKQRALLVSLSGVDGSGKTTHALALQQAFRECDIRADVVWSRGASSRFTDALICLARPLLPHRNELDLESDTREAKVARKSQWLQKPLLRWGWAWMTVFDLLLCYVRRIVWPLLLRRVVVADRYTGDALVELAVLCDRTHVAETGAGRFLHTVCPTPQISYLLDLDPETALERKPDEPPEFLDRQIFVYRHMALLWGMSVLDAREPQEVVTDQLVHKVLNTYYERWSGRS